MTKSVQCKVGTVSTHVDGNVDQVWQCVKSEVEKHII